jgi:hypothetical protein
MPKKKYLVTLSDAERAHLEHVTRRGKTAARQITRAHILLKAADDWDDAAIGHALHLGRATVERTRQRFVAGGLDALNERPRPGKQALRDAKGQARLMAEACRPAPEGRERWTLQWLADRVVALGLAEACAYETVRRILKKTHSSRG